MSTKKKIRDQALSMFNESGVEKITTRHIAASLEMSQGNLHYHYPNKNVLIQALFDDFLTEIRDAEKYTGEVFDKEAVVASMRDSFEIMHRFRFFFKDNAVIWRRLPEIKDQLLQLFTTKRAQLKAIIEAYKQADIFRKEISDAQVEFLLDQFIFTISTWLSASAYLETKENAVEYYAQYTFRIWLPYLKKKEMEGWEVLLNR